MSQYDFGNLESPVSGTTLINTHLEPWRNALHSNHSGSSRPAYAAAGMIWVDTSGTPWTVNIFDGTDDIAIGTVNATTNVFTPAGVTSYGGSAGGTANALTLTPTTALTAYAAGVAYEFLVTATNTSAAPTLNVSALGAKTIKCSVGGGKVNLPVGALQNGMIARVVYDGTDFLLLNIRANNKSANIATASTVNLDNATGDLVHLTGTTTVTAFTLAEGVEKVCVADGIFTITDGTGSSPQGIICPGTANITTAANDVFIIRGEGSGTTRIVSYTKADGTPVTSPSFSSAWEYIGSFTNTFQQHLLDEGFYMIISERATGNAVIEFSANGSSAASPNQGKYAQFDGSGTVTGSTGVTNFQGGDGILYVSKNSTQLTFFTYQNYFNNADRIRLNWGRWTSSLPSYIRFDDTSGVGGHVFKLNPA